MQMCCYTKTNQYGYIEAAYIRSEDEFQLYSEMCIAGKSCGGMQPEPFYKNYYRGSPDWYFVEGEPGDEFGPATYCFVTLNEKKERFEQIIGLIFPKSTTSIFVYTDWNAECVLVQRWKFTKAK